eukprot:1996051-Alexandrium_andersonii.AAC.1
MTSAMQQHPWPPSAPTLGCLLMSWVEAGQGWPPPELVAATCPPTILIYVFPDHQKGTPGTTFLLRARARSPLGPS